LYVIDNKVVVRLLPGPFCALLCTFLWRFGAGGALRGFRRLWRFFGRLGDFPDVFLLGVRSLVG